MTEPSASLAAAIADRYRLDREIGRGGMATVYLAHDLRHDRPVALKVLHADLAASLGPERFQREIRLAARLQHPNILGVYDSGSDAGHLWFTMPFVEGESLRDRLNREHQLPVEDATRIAREAADALHYAHQHGIVHRDIKPENLLLSSGHALVADFGIARAVGNSEAALTGTGLVVGTPAYMPPEQATGERELDARSDIYALGCVLYEMLAGEAPFTGPTAQAILSRSLSETPRPIRATRPALSAAMDLVISQAMARVPADRYATAEQFGRALALAAPEARTSGETQATASTTAARRSQRVPLLAVLGLGVLLGAGVLFAWRRSQGAATAPAGPPAVAVLPFENLGAADDDYFADGITDEVRGRLAALPSLQVIASASATQYKKTTKTPDQVANELGVRYLLVGKVRWEKSGGANRVRVSPELIEIARGRPARTVWQQPFDADLTDVFKVQGDIAAQVAQALNVAIGSTERRQLGERPTANLAAYDAYLKAEETGAIASGDPGDLRRAVQYYGQAVALDSAFAVAWARLARVQAILYANSIPDPALAASAFRSAERAVSLAPNRPEGYVALGAAHYVVNRDNAAAEGPLRRALETNPNDAEAIAILGTVKMAQGQWEEALRYFGDASRLDPRSIDNVRRNARALLWLRRYPEALPAADRTLALAPSAFQALQGKAMVYLAQGDLPGARQVLSHPPKPVEPAGFAAYMGMYWDLYWVLDDEQQRLLLRLPASAYDDNRAAMAIVRAQTLWARGDKAGARVWADSARLEFEGQSRLAPRDAQSRSFTGLAYGYLGRKEEALSNAEAGTRITSIEQDGFIGPYQVHLLARTAILVGDYGRALDALERLLKVPYFVSPGWLRIDPAFDPLRGNPRFEALVAGSASH